MPPKPNPPPSPLRVLRPDHAKARADPHSQPEQPHAPNPTSKPSPKPKATPKPSLLTTLLSRTRALPAPIKRTFRVLRILAPLVPISLFFSENVMQVMWVRGPSMTPYLNEEYDVMQTKSDMVVVDMWGVRWPWQGGRRLERGMVVTFRSPANPSHIAIKRVVGLPGDRITTREPCMKEAQTVPFNHVWLEGDARDPKRSLDSNTYGPVSVSLITGRVMGVLWPKMRMLRWEDWERGVVEGDENGTKFGAGYRGEVRGRVLKEAVKLEGPVLG